MFRHLSDSGTPVTVPSLATGLGISTPFRSRDTDPQSSCTSVAGVLPL